MNVMHVNAALLSFGLHYIHRVRLIQV